jgi:hypothetical protein
MKKIIYFLVLPLTAIITIIILMSRPVSFSGYLNKGEKVEITYFYGLKKYSISYEMLKNDKLAWHDNYTFYNENIKIPIFFKHQRFNLKFYEKNQCVFDSTYNQKNNYPIYLIGVLHPDIYQKMVTNGDDVSNYRFYFKTRQDDIELENEIRKIQDIEQKSITDSLNYSH